MRKIILASLALALTACGGGGATGGSNLPQATTPVIPSSPTESVTPVIPSPPVESTPPIVVSKATFNLTNGTGWIKSDLFDIGVKVFNPVTYNESGVFNFNSDKYDGKIIRKNGDDAAPVRMMGTTIGGRHGYSRTILTLQNLLESINRPQTFNHT